MRTKTAYHRRKNYFWRLWHTRNNIHEIGLVSFDTQRRHRWVI